MRAIHCLIARMAGSYKIIVPALCGIGVSPRLNYGANPCTTNEANYTCWRKPQ